MTGGQLFLGVAAVVFAACVFLGAPGVTWYDGGELLAGVSVLGVTHPPGQPAWMALAALAGLLPVGTLAFRLTLLSALCAALAAGALALLVGRSVARLDGFPRGVTPLPGALAGLVLGLGPALMLQGVRPELYALALLLGILALLGLQLGGRRGFALAVLPLAVAGAVHHAMLVAAIPGLAALAVGRRGLRAGLVTTAALLPLGLLQFAWLPLRSWTHPAIDAGVPRTLERVVLAATGLSYGRSFRMEDGQLASNLVEHLGVLWGALGGVAVALAAVGLVAAGARARIAGLALVGFGLLPTLLQGVFFPDNPDALGYLLGPVATLAAAAGVGAWAVTRRAGGAGWLVGLLLIVGAVAVPLVDSLERADRRELRSPQRIAAAVLHDAGPGALVLLGGDAWLMPALAAHLHERRRPDLQVEGLHLLDLAALPDLAARGRAIPASFPPPVEAGIAAAPVGLAPERVLDAIVASAPPVDVYVNDQFVSPMLLQQREPSGLLLRLHRGPGAGPPAADELPSIDDPLGREVAARRDLARGTLLLQRGQTEEALRILRRGSALAPDPWALVHLARHRVESGSLGPGPWAEDALALRGAGALVAGDVAAARADVEAVLETEPLHPTALLTAERLYTLGHHVDTATGEAP